MTKIIELADGLLKFGLLIGGMTLFRTIYVYKLEYDSKKWEAEFEKQCREAEERLAQKWGK